MELAVLSFRAAAKFAPAVPEHWYNLGTALRDEDYAGASQDSIVREARNALRKAASLRRHLGTHSATLAPVTGTGSWDGAKSDAQDHETQDAEEHVERDATNHP